MYGPRDRLAARLMRSGVVRFAALFEPAIEGGFGQQAVELAAERMAHRFGQVRSHDEQDACRG